MQPLEDSLVNEFMNHEDFIAPPGIDQREWTAYVLNRGPYPEEQALPDNDEVDRQLRGTRSWRDRRSPSITPSKRRQ